MKEFKRDSIHFMIAYVSRLISKKKHIAFENMAIFPGQPPLLFTLKKNGAMKSSDISKILKITPATTTKMIDRLIKRGIIMRYQHNKDSRVKMIDLTEKGRLIITEIKTIHRNIEADILTELNEDEIHLLKKLLIKIKKNLEENE